MVGLDGFFKEDCLGWIELGVWEKDGRCERGGGVRGGRCKWFCWGIEGKEEDVRFCVDFNEVNDWLEFWWLILCGWESELIFFVDMLRVVRRVLILLLLLCDVFCLGVEEIMFLGIVNELVWVCLIGVLIVLGWVVLDGMLLVGVLGWVWFVLKLLLVLFLFGMVEFGFCLLWFWDELFLVD